MYRAAVPIAPDHLLAVVLVILFPVRAALFSYRRLTTAEPGDLPRVRLALYRQGIAIQWTLAAMAVALWAWQRRPWAMLGVIPRLNGGLLGVAVGFAIIAGYVLSQRGRALEDPEALARLRHQMRNVERMMPRSPGELRWFAWLSVTAGICEELLYRGYLIWYLGAWFAVVPAALIASVVFGLGHAYQGPRGIAVTSLVGAFMSAIYLLTGSLVACSAFHALMDLHTGHAALVAFSRQEEAVLPAAPEPPGL